ncbi:MAG TPA: magnesium/cobalt transporter CorA [Sumerlaeia bacterium]|nr:magnesium/cobalt transporter CorA [Sumerlaeia bacterium]
METKETVEFPRKRSRKRRSPPGTPPGTLLVDPEAPKCSVRVMAYREDDVVEKTTQDLGEIRRFLQEWPVTWVNVDGLGDADTLRQLGEIFDVHKLALEDVVNVHQRPKAEQYEGHLFIILRMTEAGERIESEQFSIFLGKNFVLTFQERPGDCLDPVRDRIRSGRGRIRQVGPDYLTYAFLDAIVDHYFPLLERLGDRLEALEDEILTDPDSSTVARVHDVKRDLQTLRRAAWPLRDVMNSLLRDMSAFVADDTRVYLRDCYDHTVQILDILEVRRELCSDLRDLYLSCLSNRMNEVMKVLTIIATIFIPLSFVAGLYGMNFDPDRSPWNMPELSWYWGYPFALGVMAAVVGLLLFYFHRRGWIGSPRDREPKE